MDRGDRTARNKETGIPIHRRERLSAEWRVFVDLADRLYWGKRGSAGRRIGSNVRPTRRSDLSRRGARPIYHAARTGQEGEPTSSAPTPGRNRLVESRPSYTAHLGHDRGHV